LKITLLKVKFFKVIIDEKNRSSIYRISKNYGFHRFLTKNYLEENDAKRENNLDVNESHQLVPEKDFKEFCVDMENLCEKYEKEICKYKKDLEEFNNRDKINNRKISINLENRDNLIIEKCDASINTEELTVDNLKDFLFKIDDNLIIDKKKGILKFIISELIILFY